ncbi:MAG: 1-phosphofructokinase [Ruminococcus sp.]|nr:1-phosphofructokinase [Ruminococcus sp.]
MIYTVTLNPAIDFIINMDNPILGTINRSDSETLYCGGKGINVSMVLKELEVHSIATGFLAGFTGKEIEETLQNQGVQTDFVHLENGITRINVKIRSDEETDINTKGPSISDYDLHLLIKKFDEINSDDIVILSGSAPKNADDTIYAKLLSKIAKSGAMTVVDSTKKKLLNTLEYKPFLIKPNINELIETFDAKISTLHDVEKYAIKLQNLGARNVLVSMGDKGSVLFTEDKQVILQSAPQGEAINTVGAGDSMVAGFIAGYLKSKDYKFALKLATACGSATAFSEGLCKQNEISRMLELIESK